MILAKRITSVIIPTTELSLYSIGTITLPATTKALIGIHAIPLNYPFFNDPDNADKNGGSGTGGGSNSGGGSGPGGGSNSGGGSGTGGGSNSGGGGNTGISSNNYLVGIGLAGQTSNTFASSLSQFTFPITGNSLVASYDAAGQGIHAYFICPSSKTPAFSFGGFTGGFLNIGTITLNNIAFTIWQSTTANLGSFNLNVLY